MCATTLQNCHGQVLYFDVADLLLHTDYLNELPDLRNVVRNSLTVSKARFIERVTLDPAGIKLLKEFSQKSNVLLYPLASVFNRDFLIKQGLDADCLALDMPLHRRFNDSNQIRQMLAHAYAVKADWRVVGNLVQYDMQLSDFAVRYIKMNDSASGVTKNLIKRISDSFQSQKN
ncbi:hypothetical protein [Photobacterium lutimaris]|uniref:Uncharacterized protein n=1 Tax=Photobacterium lutimaris TaxID=388278 RepID=A0A2T3ITQ2_9GAMM|nr:hypothetical protein [Photobacterium lutimaris]PSU31746.1 hypothetical protein C9I99_21410 [Photobacterium lutimaris]TDR72608.1 hypothetical protein DFP78_11384 [Photobacterium lutimaris]